MSERDAKGRRAGDGPPSRTARAYRGRLLTPVGSGGLARDPHAEPRGLRYLEDALLVVDGGRLAAVLPYADAGGAFRGPVADLRPWLLMPGFVDTHLHFPQTRVVGSASGPLLAWLERSVFPEEARFRDEGYARAVARELIARLVHAGTTTSAIFSSSSPRATDVLFEELAREGLRAIAGLTLMDERCPEALRLPASEAIAASERLIARWHGHDGGRLAFAVTPRFALSCSRALLEGAARLAQDHALLVQTHVAETPDEGAQTLVAHPIAADYLGVYDALGLVGGRTLLAHGIHLSPLEWDRVAERGAAVAHCPDSNFFLGSGRMRLGEPRSRGVRVGLGTDVAAGRTFSVRRNVGSAYDNALCAGQAVRPEELLALATLGGAEALGLSAVTGSLEVGKDADFIALRLPAHVESEAQVVAEVAFGDAVAVERAFVRGRQLGQR